MQRPRFIDNTTALLIFKSLGQVALSPVLLQKVATWSAKVAATFVRSCQLIYHRSQQIFWIKKGK